MALTVKSLANGQLGTTSQGTLYTVPSGKAAIVKNIRVANTDTSARTFNLWFKLSGGTARLISASAMSLGAGNWPLMIRKSPWAQPIRSWAMVAWPTSWTTSSVELRGTHENCRYTMSGGAVGQEFPRNRHVRRRVGRGCDIRRLFDSAWPGSEQQHLHAQSFHLLHQHYDQQRCYNQNRRLQNLLHRHVARE